MGEEQLRIAARAQIGYLDRLNAGAIEQLTRSRDQVEHPPVGNAVEVGEAREHLLAHLVTALTDPWSDRRRAGTDRVHPALDQATGERAPSAVQHRHAALTDQGD